MCEYLPHINSSLVDLRTEHVLAGIPYWTQRSPNCTRCACCCETGVALAGFLCWWKSPAVSWSRPRCQGESPVGPLTNNQKGNLLLTLTALNRVSARLSAHPNNVLVNLVEQPNDNRRLSRHLPNDLPEIPSVTCYICSSNF
jgi:hypothetical protein